MKVGTQLGIGVGASPVLLAPERNVSIIGSSLDVPPVLAAVYARRVKTRGNVLIEDQYTDDLPCHPYH